MKLHSKFLQKIGLSTLIIVVNGCQFEPPLVPPPLLDQQYIQVKNIISELDTGGINKIKDISPHWTHYKKCRSALSQNTCAIEMESLYSQVDSLLKSEEKNSLSILLKLNEKLPFLEKYEEKIIGREIRKNYSSLIDPSIYTETCKNDSVSITQTEDHSAVSILFSDMQLEGAPRTTFRKRCSANITIQIPAGQKAAIYKIDYRGFSQLPKGANALFKVQYSNGSNKLKPFKRLMQANESDFLFTDRLNPSDFKFFGCGEDIALVATTEIILENYSQSEFAMASLDSADGTARQAGISFGIKMTNCR